MTTDRTALDAAVDQLYRAFAHHPLRAWTEPCTACCTTVETEAALHAAPLQALPIAVITEYEYHAMMTWGDEREFNHLLPRVFELGIDTEFHLNGVESLGWALSRARPSWTAAEQAAVEHALLELWRFELIRPSPVYEPGSLLCVAGWATDDLAPFLTSWATETRPGPAQQVRRFLEMDWQPWEAQVDDNWWTTDRGESSPRQAQVHQIEAWVRGPHPWRVLDAGIAAREEPVEALEAALLILEGTTGAVRPGSPTT